jgi:transcriptional regulator with XRE-family HTH domain
MASLDIHKTLALRVRQLREQRGYSQESLAALAGLNRSYIGSVERAEHNIGVNNLVRIATALEVPISALFEFGKPPRTTPPTQQPSAVAHRAVVNTSQFQELLDQCVRRAFRPDLVIIYLERCGVEFI